MATIKVAAVNPKKSGATNGRKWTLYEVRAQDGKTYTTFDSEWRRHIGQTVEVTVSERNRLGPAPKAAAPTSSAPGSPDRFAVLNEKLDRMVLELAEVRKHFA